MNCRAVAHIQEFPVSTLDSTTLRHLQGECRAWLGDHVAMLEGIPSKRLRREIAAEWADDEQAVYVTLQAVSAELRLRGHMS